MQVTAIRLSFCGNGANMRYLVSAAEMRLYDNNTTEKIGLSAGVLMERAALAVMQAIEERCRIKDGRKSVLIMAGMGNNGGDGLALARLLSKGRYEVEVWCVGDRKKASPQWLQQEKILAHYPVKMVQAPSRGSYDVLADALFGVGLSREITGEFAQAILKYNEMEGLRFALDLPSGIDADTGAILGCAARADVTVTFGFCKRGLVLYPGCVCAGMVTVAEIGIGEESFFGEEPGMFAYDGTAAELLPRRSGAGNKGTFGKVLLVAGTKNMAGAAVLAARAAYRTGAGMVKVITSEANRVILQQAVPEALFGTEEDLAEAEAWADVIAAGPGMGRGESARRCLRAVIFDSRIPLVIDADGLNLLAEDRALFEELGIRGKAGRSIVLTPHAGELSRLTGVPVGGLKRDLAGHGMKLAEQVHGVVAAKDARTFICGEKRPVCVNLTGNSGMATAGSGDVLTGMIAGLLAQGMDAFRAASVGVYLHGMAGDAAAERLGEHACMAGDISEAMGNICVRQVLTE